MKHWDWKGAFRERVLWYVLLGWVLGTLLGVMHRGWQPHHGTLLAWLTPLVFVLLGFLCRAYIGRKR